MYKNDTDADGKEYVYCGNCGYRDEWFGTDYFGLCDDCQADVDAGVDLDQEVSDT